VTDRHRLAAAHPAEELEMLLNKIGAAAEAGVDWIQIREKDLSGKDSRSLTREALLRTAKSSVGKTSPTRIIVNDRLDVALAERAGGVHLGEKSLPVAEARRLVENRGEKRDFLMGVSCHSLEAACAAASGGADYLFFGPVFATPSKAAFGAPLGLEGLAEVCRAVCIPVLAIGGMTIANSTACWAAGASGIAAIRLFQDAPDLCSLLPALGKFAR
jgi:thiamine-phosphate pyrophosphorylase